MDQEGFVSIHLYCERMVAETNMLDRKSDCCMFGNGLSNQLCIIIIIYFFCTLISHRYHFFRHGAIGRRSSQRLRLRKAKGVYRGK